ncbi:MAG: glycoside hydrolase [Nitrospirota bacterium]|nr:glycoside hydrolase [Nitrospirota bacterium]
MKLKYHFILFFLFVIIAGCTIKEAHKETVSEPSLAHPAMDAGLYEGPSIVVHQGTPIYTWYDLKRRLMVGSGDRTIEVSEGSPSPSLLSFNVLHSDGHSLYFLFRPKGAMGEGWKYVIFRASHDRGKTLTEPVILNRGEGAMEPTIAASGKGEVYAAWYDERDGQFDLYMNVSHDYGKTWLGEIRLNTENEPGKGGAVSPDIIVHGNNVWVIWINAGKNKVRKLMIRSSVDAGRSWSEPAVLREKENFYDPRIMMIKGRMVILWNSTSPSSRMQYIAKGIYSDDLGKTWHPTGDIKVTSWMQFEINPSVDESGNLYMAVALRDKFKTGIDNIFFVMSSDRGGTWSEPVRIQKNTSHHTIANLPQIVSDDSGRVLVAWVDYRNIRGNIYANFSKDYGKTWLKEDILLSTMKNNANLPRIATDGGKFYSVWLEYNDDTMKKGIVRVREVQVK